MSFRSYLEIIAATLEVIAAKSASVLAILHAYVMYDS